MSFSKANSSLYPEEKKLWILGTNYFNFLCFSNWIYFKVLLNYKFSYQHCKHFCFYWKNRIHFWNKKRHIHLLFVLANYIFHKAVKKNVLHPVVPEGMLNSSLDLFDYWLICGNMLTQPFLWKSHFPFLSFLNWYVIFLPFCHMINVALKGSRINKHMLRWKHLYFKCALLS